MLLLEIGIALFKVLLFLIGFALVPIIALYIFHDGLATVVFGFIWLFIWPAVYSGLTNPRSAPYVSDHDAGSTDGSAGIGE